MTTTAATTSRPICSGRLLAKLPLFPVCAFTIDHLPPDFRGLTPAVARRSSDEKLPDIPVEHELLARHQRDVEDDMPVAICNLLWSAFNERVTFEQRRPNKRKVIAAA
jgi:hypothetical protein